VTGQGWVAFSLFHLINTRVGRMKKGDNLQETFERTLKSFFKRTRRRDRKGEKDIERRLKERFEIEGMI
jgi:hypothetical protein